MASASRPKRKGRIASSLHTPPHEISFSEPSISSPAPPSSPQWEGGGSPTDLHELLGAIKTKFSKNSSEHQRQLTDNIRTASEDLHRAISSATRKHDQAVYGSHASKRICRESKISSIRRALIDHQKERIASAKRFRSDYERFCGVVGAAIEQVEQSNEQIAKLVATFDEDCENVRRDRKSETESLTKSAQSEVDRLKRGILSAASVTAHSG